MLNTIKYIMKKQRNQNLKIIRYILKINFTPNYHYKIPVILSSLTLVFVIVYESGEDY